MKIKAYTHAYVFQGKLRSKYCRYTKKLKPQETVQINMQCHLVNDMYLGVK